MIPKVPTYLTKRPITGTRGGGGRPKYGMDIQLIGLFVCVCMQIFSMFGTLGRSYSFSYLFALEAGLGAQLDRAKREKNI